MTFESSYRSLAPWLQLCLKLIWAGYMLLTSFYCLLAFFPYTYYALIKSPVYEWMPWFAQQHGRLFFVALLALVAAYFDRVNRVVLGIGVAALVIVGIFINVHPVLTTLTGGTSAYLWSLAALAPILFFAAFDVVSRWRDEPGWQASTAYLPLVLSAFLIALLNLSGPVIQDYRQTHTVSWHLADSEKAVWSVFTHLVVAVVVVSLLNLIFGAASRIPRPRAAACSGICGLVWLVGSYGLVRFLRAALGFAGPLAIVYSTLLMATLVLFLLSIALHTSEEIKRLYPVEKSSFPRRVFFGLSAVVLAVCAFLLPSTLSEWDWNGIVQWGFTLFLWFSLTACLYAVLRIRKTYSMPTIIAVLIVTLAGYKLLQLGDVVWGKALGATDEDIRWSLEQYGKRDASFRLAHHLLGNTPMEWPCSDFCRILTQYTNIRDPHTDRKIDFTNPLVPAPGKKPDIFMIVVDSMRPDYIGAYNSKSDFTPNMDALAADGVVMRHAYTQYAGTYLSEPAIWSGALLLHAHYVRPFENVNSLERLVNADGYDMVVSYDNIIPELLAPNQPLTKLDTDKKIWKQLEFCSTVGQLEHVLDTRESDRPVFFYAQPQNVQMFASNDQPKASALHWRRDGFDPRVSLAMHQVDACLGEFVSYLKVHQLYDQSIIIITSDHGDALGDFGRHAHSYVVYPEVMRVPLIIHLPSKIRQKVLYDPQRLTTLIDISPSLYYLLGHKPVARGPLLGQPIFVDTHEELSSYSPRDEMFLASDEAPIYGLLEKGRYFYTTNASPPESFLFDLQKDPNAEHNILTPEQKKRYDLQIIDNLKMIGDFYGYKLGVNALLAAQTR